MASRSTSKPFPGFASIHDLTESFSDHVFHARVDMTGKQDIQLTRAEMTLPNPVKARWFTGRKKPSDIIGTTLVIPLLMSERVVTLLKDKGFTGWRTYDVDLVGHDGTPIPGYHGLAVFGRCGPIDNGKSVEMPTMYPGGIFPAWHGLYFDPDTWDGSDFFMPGDDYNAIFVVEDVKRAFHKARISNVAFTRLTDITRSRLDIEIMEQQRAAHRADKTGDK